MPHSPLTPETELPLLRLVWMDVTGVTVGVEGIARDEAGLILDEAGLDVVWRCGTGGEEAQAGEIRIILVDRLVVNGESGEPVLGATPHQLREHPLVWIHVPGVRATLGLSPDSSGVDLSARERRDMGVALGRVIAHEIVHAVVPDVAHGGALMSHSLKRHQLTGTRLLVEPAVALAVRDALLAPPTLRRSEGVVRTAAGATRPEPRADDTATADRR